MSANCTPGPWVTNTAGSAKKDQPFKITEIYVYAPDTQDDTAICADVIDPVTQEPSEANARLISAAPDLLDAAKLCLSIAESWINQEYGGERFHKAHKVLDPARAAIKKATGGSEIPAFPIIAQPVAQRSTVDAAMTRLENDNDFRNAELRDIRRELTAIAQSVEVQRVAMSDEQACEIIWYGHMNQMDLVRAIERAHGIKPASEGGA